MQFNVVDVDSRELVAGWLVTCSAAAPAVLRTYDVDVMPNVPVMKKIMVKNPWDTHRNFTLASSNAQLMEPRNSSLEVPAMGSAHIRLRFRCPAPGAGTVEVYLFLNDDAGQNEESYLFQLREATAAYA